MEFECGLVQPTILRPQWDSCHDRRGKKMGVNVAQAFPGKITRFDEGQHLFVGGDGNPRQSTQQRDDLRPVDQIAAGQFADDERVAQDQAFIQKSV